MSNIIPIDFEGHPMRFSDDGWFDATAAADKFNKEPAQWLRLPETVRYIEALKSRYRSINMARPTKYQEAYAEQARKLCLLGYTDAELADFFEVSESTINKWKLDYPKFSESIKKGKAVADAEVSDRLYQRAMGFVAPDIDIRVIENRIVETPLEKYYPPDTTAAIFWLKNRQKDKWRDKVDHELTGKDGGAIQIETSPMSTLFGK